MHVQQKRFSVFYDYVTVGKISFTGFYRFYFGTVKGYSCFILFDNFIKKRSFSVICDNFYFLSGKRI